MSVLIVHNGYRIRGGEDECFEAEANLLREMGHPIGIYEESNDRTADMSSVDLALKTVWSQETYRRVRQELHDHLYHVVHVHNFLPLISPSVYYAARAEGIPVVQTLHNYRLLCPNALFFRAGKVCEECLGQKIPVSGIRHGCYRGSRVATGATATMLSVHRLLKTWSDTVTLYIALTEFARQKFIEGGLPADRIVVKPHFVYPDPGFELGRRDYALFVGRLSVEKGLDTLLAAWELLEGKIPLKIVGDGPLADQVAVAAQQIPGVEWLGRKPLSEVYELLGRAKCLVFPSKWYETFGRVTIEAFAKGTPVLAADIGAIAEIVEPGRTGLHFYPGDAHDLAAKVEYLFSNPALLSQMRREARAEFEEKYTAQANYQKLMGIYKLATNQRVQRQWLPR